MIGIFLSCICIISCKYIYPVYVSSYPSKVKGSTREIRERTVYSIAELSIAGKDLG